MDTLKDTSVSRRCKRGIELAAKGMVTRHGDLWIVHGRGGNYTVSLDHQTYGEVCSCPDWKINVLERGNQDHRCKHIYSVALVAARG